MPGSTRPYPRHRFPRKRRCAGSEPGAYRHAVAPIQKVTTEQNVTTEVEILRAFRYIV
jgi:hypothetical protein